MSRQITQPINQVKLTNVAIVRYSCKGKRFEIACYRNKVLDYRSGLETDLSEVLQSDRIFTNVSKGQFAKTCDLEKAFGSGKSQEEICQIILDKGKSLQVSDLERNHVLENTLTQIATWVAHNCVHPVTGRPYTVSQIKQALGKNYQVQSHKAIKKQYLDAVRFLKNVIPIERAKMELSLQYPVTQQEIIRPEWERIMAMGQEQEHQADGTIISHPEIQSNKIVKQVTAKDGFALVVMHVDPSLYRPLNELAQQHAGSRLEILQQVVQDESGDVDLEQELANRRKVGAASADKNAVSSVASASRQVDDYVDEEAVELEEKLKSVRLHQEVETPERRPVAKSPEKSFASNNVPSQTLDDDETSSDTEHRLIDDSNDDSLLVQPRRNQRKEQKKKSKQAKRRQQHQSILLPEEEDASDGKQQQEAPEKNETALPPPTVASAAAADGAKSCNTCGGSFASAADYRAHFRTNWHRFNQKLKLKGIQPVSEQEFQLCDQDTFFGED